jgi:hypothetical protein
MTIHAGKAGSSLSWIRIALMFAFAISAYATQLYGLHP